MRTLNTKEIVSFMRVIIKIFQSITASVEKFIMTIDIFINLTSTTQDVSNRNDDIGKVIGWVISSRKEFYKETLVVDADIDKVNNL